MKKAMITIEVLVSMLILFLVISTSFTNIKFFNLLSSKKDNYEELFVSVLSIKDKLSSNICKQKLSFDGEFNGFSYSAKCKKLKELKTYSFASEIDEVSGNFGTHNMKLYEIKLELSKGRLKKVYTYHKTIDIRVQI